MNGQNVITRAELRLILKQARSKVPGAMHLSGQRNGTALTLAYNAGLRVGELVKLRVADFVSPRQRQPFLRVRPLKKKRAELYDAPLADKVVRRLRTWLQRYQHGITWPHAEGSPAPFVDWPMFPRLPVSWCADGTPVPAHKRSFQRAFARAAERAGLQRPVSIHALRHLRGSVLWAETHDLVVVRDGLRHASMRSVERYVHLHPAALAQVTERTAVI